MFFEVYTLSKETFVLWSEFNLITYILVQLGGWLGGWGLDGWLGGRWWVAIYLESNHDPE